MNFRTIVKTVVTLAIITVAIGALAYLLVWETPIFAKPDIDDYYVPGLIVVGFVKEYYPLEEVRRLMNETDLEYIETRNVNRGAKFDQAVGNLFLVRVPEGEEEELIDEFNSLPFIYAAGHYINPELIQIE